NRGHDDIEGVGSQFFDGKECLVLPSEQNVADATLNEGGGRAAGAAVENRNVAVKIGDELADQFFVAAEFPVGPGPGSNEVPARAARSLGVWSDHLDPVLDEIAPVGEVLGIALAHQEH